MRNRPGHRHGLRQRPAPRPDPRHQRAQVRPVVGRRPGGVGVRRRGQVPGQNAMRRREVREVVVIHRPDDRQPVRPGRQHREVLADPHPRRPRRDRGEAATDLRRRIGLRVPCVELAGPAPHEDEEARLRLPEPARPRPGRPVPIQLRQPQPGHRHRPGTQRLATRDRSPPELAATPPLPHPRFVHRGIPGIQPLINNSQPRLYWTEPAASTGFLKVGPWSIGPGRRRTASAWPRRTCRPGPPGTIKSPGRCDDHGQRTETARARRGPRIPQNRQN